MAKSHSILLVDDDEDLAHTLSVLLRAHGYEVLTARNGAEGYGKYFSNPTEVVITDIQMPKMDGFEMMRCIRDINPAVRTIYLSGALQRFQKYLDSEEREFSVASLLKPISTKALLDAMSSDVALA